MLDWFFDTFTKSLITNIVILTFIIYFISRLIKRRKKKRKRQSATLNQQYGTYSHSNIFNPRVPSEESIQFLNKIIKALDPTEKDIEKAFNGFQFNVPSSSPFSLFLRIKVVIFAQSTYKLFATLNKIFPASLTIQSKQDLRRKDTGFIISPLSDFFVLLSPSPAMWEEVLNNQKVQDSLLKLKGKVKRTYTQDVKYIYIRDNYVESILVGEQTVIDLVKLIILMHQQMKKLFSGLEDFEVEKLLCYNCEDPFDPLEEVCDKCGAPRPRCIVCHLDLKPSEKEEVVTLPCCGVYAHKNHIISWLEQNPQCPNCHTNLNHWLKKIKLL
ncbi:MAG: hypothetical protein ACTSSG_09325 [Candidatus Heimdallarchaeaceae archaeon]